LLNVKVHAANVHDTIFGPEVFEKAVTKFPTIKGGSGDEAYRGTAKNYVKNVLKKTFDIPKKEIPWKISPKRWIVERTLAWMGGSRRLAKDYETTVNSQENMVWISASSLALRSLKFS